jgi:hypothetical protein
MNNQARNVWLVLTLSRAGIAFSIEVQSDERQSWLNWAKRRGLRLVAAFSSHSLANKAVNRWIAVHRRHDFFVRRFNPVIRMPDSPFNRYREAGHESERFLRHAATRH